MEQENWRVIVGHEDCPYRVHLKEGVACGRTIHKDDQPEPCCKAICPVEECLVANVDAVDLEKIANTSAETSPAKNKGVNPHQQRMERVFAAKKAEEEANIAAWQDSMQEDSIDSYINR